VELETFLSNVFHLVMVKFSFGLIGVSHDVFFVCLYPGEGGFDSIDICMRGRVSIGFRLAFPAHFKAVKFVVDALHLAITVLASVRSISVDLWLVYDGICLYTNLIGLFCIS
jgi:hypothetical protein